MNPYFWILPAYVLGSFPTGVFLSRRKFGIDVREIGSGNIGATNVTRVFGWYAGLTVFLIDFLKGLIPMWLCRLYYPSEPWLLTGVGTALVLGHCFSIFLNFRGGKGVATGLGSVLIVAPWAAVLSTAVYATLLAKTKISAVGSLAGVGVIMIYMMVAKSPLNVTALLLGIIFIVTIQHRSNIRRLIAEWRAGK